MIGKNLISIQSASRRTCLKIIRDIFMLDAITDRLSNFVGRKKATTISLLNLFFISARASDFISNKLTL